MIPRKTYFQEHGESLPISMLNSHHVTCAGGCGKTIRITKSQYRRNIDRCRTCFLETGQTRPIPGREKKRPVAGYMKSKRKAASKHKS